MLLARGTDDPKAVLEKEMLRYCKVARSNFRTFFDQQKNDNKNMLVEKKKLQKRTLLDKERKGLKECEKDAESLTNEADHLARKTGKFSKLEFIRESNLKRKRVTDLMEEVKVTEAKILKLEAV